MRVEFVNQGHEVLQLVGGVDTIAQSARTCYRSEAKDEDADERLVRSLIRNGHHAMLEFGWLMVRFVTDRAVANELVRHRHLSFAQESTRYVGYDKKGFAFVLPDGLDEVETYEVTRLCERAANAYVNMARWTDPQTARAILPLCIATRLTCAGNLREWRHVLTLRTARDAHPQMRALMLPLLAELKERVPVAFDDIGTEGK